jgi:HNH endonuclease
MKTIIVNKKRIFIDEDDIYKLLSFHFNVITKGTISYLVARPHLGYKDNKRQRSTLYIHRLIMNVWDRNIHVDHINGNGLDNRKSNLRLCSNQQNSFNQIGQPKQRKNVKYKGVKKNTNCKTWSARLTFNGKSIYLGCFKTQKLAALEYNKAAIKYFGKFAYLNKVVK